MPLYSWVVLAKTSKESRMGEIRVRKRETVIAPQSHLVWGGKWPKWKEGKQVGLKILCFCFFTERDLHQINDKMLVYFEIIGKVLFCCCQRNLKFVKCKSFAFVWAFSLLSFLMLDLRDSASVFLCSIYLWK